MIAQTITQKMSGFTTMKAPFGLPLLAAALLCGGAQQQASATSYSWVNAKIVNFSDTTGWVGGVAPVSNLDNVLTFSISLNSTATNDLGTVQLNRLVATNTSSSNKNLTIAGASNPLNFVTNSSSALPTLAIANNSVSGAMTISIPFTVTDALTISNSGARGAAISGAITNTGGMTFDGTGAGAITLGTGAISGAGGITIGGSYNVNMSGNNTYDGLTDVQSGTLILNRSGGTIKNASAVRVSGGTLSVAQDDTVGAVTLSSGTISGVGTLTGFSYSLTNSGTISAGLAGTGTLTKTGVGTVTLSGANTFSGATTVTEGPLSLASSLANTSAVTVNGGTLISSVANVNLGVGAVSMSTGAMTPGGAGTVGSFTLAANQNFSATGGTLNFDLISLASFDQIIGSGTGTFSLTGATLSLSGLTSEVGTYQIFSGFTTLGSTVSGLFITGLAEGYTGSLENSGMLTIAAIPEPSTYAMLAGVLALGMGVWRRARGRTV